MSTTQTRVMNELSSRHHGKQRSRAVINRAIGAGLFAAGVGLCIVVSHAPDQSSVEVEACANNLCPSTFGSAFSVVEGEAIRVAIGDSSDGVSAPLDGAGLDDVGIADEDPRRGIGDPSDGVSAPFGGTGVDVGITDPTEGGSAPHSNVGVDAGIGDPADGVSAPHSRTPSDG